MKTHLRVQCLENKRPTHRYKMENKITDQEGLKITIDHKLIDKWLKKSAWQNSHRWPMPIFW